MACRRLTQPSITWIRPRSKNAAMVEEMNAAGAGLAQEAANLSRLLQQFVWKKKIDVERSQLKQFLLAQAKGHKIHVSCPCARLQMAAHGFLHVFHF